jgi:putative ABC transport system permease protein
LGELPEVEAVSAVSFAPPFALYAPTPFVPSGQAADPGRNPTASILNVLPGYFETLRIPIVNGRAVTRVDTADSAPVVVVSQAVARRYFPRGDALGQSFRLTGGDRREWRIVGVAGDVRSQGLSTEAPDILYFPHSQMPGATMTFLIRTRTAPMRVANAVERLLWSLGRSMNVYGVATLEERLSDSYWQSRFMMALLTVFAGLALLLAAAGVYGVMSYLTAQRTQEIGIRIAIGASPLRVVLLVTSQGLWAAMAGLAAGTAGCVVIGRLLASQLYGVGATDPLTLTGVAVGLMAVCVAASAVPALRAVRVDPLLAVRHNG